MLFNSIFRNVNVTLLCTTNTPTMLHAAFPEKWSFHLTGGDSAPSFWIFWIRSCQFFVEKKQQHWQTSTLLRLWISGTRTVKCDAVFFTYQSWLNCQLHEWASIRKTTPSRSPSVPLFFLGLREGEGLVPPGWTKPCGWQVNSCISCVLVPSAN